jgi:hypothetical protein
MKIEILNMIGKTVFWCAIVCSLVMLKGCNDTTPSPTPTRLAFCAPELAPHIEIHLPDPIDTTIYDDNGNEIV